jgi:hypothetical protein
MNQQRGVRVLVWIVVIAMVLGILASVVSVFM